MLELWLKIVLLISTLPPRLLCLLQYEYTVEPQGWVCKILLFCLVQTSLNQSSSIWSGIDTITNTSSYPGSSQLPILFIYQWGWISGVDHTRRQKSAGLAQWYKLVKWSWLQLMCCAVCLSHNHNFRRLNEVWDEDECWFGISPLNTRDWV